MTATVPPPAASSGPASDPAIVAATQERKITQVVHFTTNQGLLGILVEQLLQARALLDKDKYLESIYHQNSKFRREAPQYWSYVNLSISRANYRFLGISTDKWWADSDLFWAVLSFDPEIMAHSGVLFAPTNMGYEGIEPIPGVEGLQALFAERVPAGWGRQTYRTRRFTDDLPTCPQAEVLYPQAVPTSFLRRVSVMNAEDAAKAHGIVSVSGHDEIDIIVDPTAFGK